MGTPATSGYANIVEFNIFERPHPRKHIDLRHSTIMEPRARQQPAHQFTILQNQ